MQGFPSQEAPPNSGHLHCWVGSFASSSDAVNNAGRATQARQSVFLNNMQ